jgi:hypothetical protein
MRHEEDHLQTQIAFELRRRGVLFCASAGGMHTPNKRAAARMKAMGYQRGVPDIFIYEPQGKYHGMSIEIKVGSYPSKEQLKWMGDLERAGYFALIVPATYDFFGARDFIENQINWYLEGAK